MPYVVIWELSCSSVRAPLASWGQWLSFANVPLHENWAEPGQESLDETIHNPQTYDKTFRQEFAEMLSLLKVQSS